jgi:hypothetical protein
MTLTTEQPGTVESPSLAPPRPPKPSTRLRVVVGWVAVVAAVVAAGVFAAIVVTHGGPSRIDTGRIVAEHGSVNAIDHRDQVFARSGSRTVAEHGSVNAIDHRAGR